jgi:hypothetical protein
MIYIKLLDPLCGAQMCTSMSALGHKRTCALQKAMSASFPKPTAKADFSQGVMSALRPCVDGSELARAFFKYAARCPTCRCTAGHSPPDRSDLFINHAVKSLTDTLNFLPSICAILTVECERVDYHKQAEE